MLAVTMSNGSDITAERLLRLTELYQAGQASPLVTTTINKLFAHEIAESRMQLEQ